MPIRTLYNKLCVVINLQSDFEQTSNLYMTMKSVFVLIYCIEACFCFARHWWGFLFSFQEYTGVILLNGLGLKLSARTQRPGHVQRKKELDSSLKQFNHYC